MIDHLIADLNAARVDFTTDRDIVAGHTTDWTGRFTGHADVLARPRNTGEVQLALRAASTNGAYVTVQGGNTGLVGGSVPPPHPDRPVLILSTTRLDGLGPVDVAARTMTAGAGATLAAVQHHAAASGLLYGVDLAARDSATIGGTVATNAGGIRVCGYGMTRAQVVGVEAVLSDGTVISRMVGLPKDNTGYDLPGLLSGSEGTLAVITEVMVRLHEAPRESVVMLLPAADLSGALNMIRHSVPAEATLLGAEVVDAATLNLVCESGGLPQPFGAAVDSAYVLLLEATDIKPPHDLQAVAVAAIDAADQRRVWSYRERASEAASTLGVVHKLDISVPLHQLDELVDGVRALVPEHATLLVFGHLADGNLHFEIAGVDPSDTALDEAILRLATTLGGAVSAEHGVGQAKASALPLSRTTGDIEVMSRLKEALDPTWTLNPGVLLPHRPSPSPRVGD
jgi:FAD/FMN-containing dehydrogenase